MDLFNNAYSGATAALFSALLWAIASTFFERAGKKIVPVELNLIKGALALVFIGITLLVTGETFTTINLRSVIFLILSGVIGIGVGDTAYFKSLDHLGARRALLIGSINPAMTTLIAMLFLGENLSLMAWLGISITIAGITWVIAERSNGRGDEHNFPIQGVVFGLIASLGQAVGAVLSRAVLSQGAVSPLQSNLFRLGAGIISLGIWIVINRIPIGGWIRFEKSQKTALQIVSATFLGTFLGMWLQQTAIKLSPVGIAQTLSSTSPLFILPIAIFGQEKISLRAVLGALLAMSGIILLFLA